MKNIIATLVLFSSTSAFAANTTTVQVTPKTTHIEVTMHSAREHNCPNSRDIRVKTTTMGPAQKVVLEENGAATIAVDRLVSQMSNECQSEAEEIKMKERTGPTCLSFGKSWAFVVINVAEGATSVRVTAPQGMEITSTQLLTTTNNTDNNAGEIDCSIRPPAVLCCQAQIPSCISCRQKSLERQAAWDKACGN